jgi:hypothetical protein
MFQSAQLAHVDRLHRIGRQLSTLKRLYQSYMLILDRLFGKEIPASSESTLGLVDKNGQRVTTPFQVGEAYDHLGVYMSTPARVRFERLRDRIQLYALTEIQECMELKDSLLAMVTRRLMLSYHSSLMRTTEFQPYHDQRE